MAGKSICSVIIIIKMNKFQILNTFKQGQPCIETVPCIQIHSIVLKSSSNSSEMHENCSQQSPSNRLDSTILILSSFTFRWPYFNLVVHRTMKHCICKRLPIYEHVHSLTVEFYIRTRTMEFPVIKHLLFFSWNTYSLYGWPLISY